MQDFVSVRWIRVAGLIASLSLIWAVFGLGRYPWMGPTWVALASLGGLWLGLQSSRSMGQVIDDVEAEPVPAVIAPGPVRSAGR